MDLSNIWQSVTQTDAWTYIKEKQVYGDFNLWHVILFMVIGPMLTWPMLILLLLVFSTQTVNIFKGVKSSTSSNG